MNRAVFLFFISFGHAFLGQNVYIPDPNFKSYLLGNSSINTNADTEIQIAEANAYNGEISCSFCNISDLTGVEEFVLVETINLYGNSISSIDLSQNTGLTYLRLSSNELSSIDLSANLLLQHLFIEENNLTSINLDQHLFLETIMCGSNELNLINVSSCLELIEFGIENNFLTEIDVSENTKLQYFYLSNNNVLNLDLSQNGLLLDLDFRNNQLSTVDISQNSLLLYLDCEGNELTELDLSNNLELESVYCTSNAIASIDVSMINTMYELLCSENDLYCLNVKNGNIDEFYLEASGNPNLACIEVDDVSLAQSYVDSQYWDVDVGSSFSVECNEDCFGTTSITESQINSSPVSIIDPLGRTTPFKMNSVLIFVYEDGTTQKVFRIDN